MSRIDLRDVIVNENSGAINRWSCKKCRNNILKELLIMIAGTVGSLWIYTTLAMTVFVRYNIHFNLRFDAIGIWIGMSFFALWALTCKITFSYIDRITFHHACIHSSKHTHH